MEMAMSIDICKGEDESGKEESSTKEETCCGSRCPWHLDAGSQSDGSVGQGLQFLPLPSLCLPGSFYKKNR
jgi:hypothetical protein